MGPSSIAVCPEWDPKYTMPGQIWSQDYSWGLYGNQPTLCWDVSRAEFHPQHCANWATLSLSGLVIFENVKLGIELLSSVLLSAWFLVSRNSF